MVKGHGPLVEEHCHIGWLLSDLVLFTPRARFRPEEVAFGFSWFIPAIVKHRRLLGDVLLASFFVQLLALVAPLFTQVVIDKVLVHKGFTTLHVMAVGMVALALFDALLSGLRTYLFAHTSNRIDVGLGAQLFRHLLALPLAYFEARRVGDTVARARELEQIRQFLTSNAVTVLLDLLFTAVFLLVMWWYSPALTLVVLVSLPLYAILSMAITPMIRTRLNEKFNRGAENQSFLVETISGIQTVKALAVEPSLQRRWDDQLAGYVGASFRATSLITIAGQIASFIQKATTIAILWTGAYLVIGGDLSIGQLIAFNMLAGQVTGPLLRLVNLWQEFQQIGISMQRLGDVLNAKPEPAANPNRTALPQVAGQITLEDVTFRYRPDAREVLHQVSLLIQPVRTLSRTVAIRSPEIVHAFLEGRRVSESKQYIAQICYEASAYFPVYYYIRQAGLSLSQSRDFVEEVQSRYKAKQKLLERLASDDHLALSLPSETRDSGRAKNRYRQLLLHTDVAESVPISDLRYVLQAIRTLAPNQIHASYLRDRLKTWFDKYYTHNDGALADDLRRSIAFLDRVLNREEIGG